MIKIKLFLLLEAFRGKEQSQFFTWLVFLLDKNHLIFLHIVCLLCAISLCDHFTGFLLTV